MTASDSVFDSRVGFPGQPIQQRLCRGCNCAMQVTVKLGIGQHSSYVFAADSQW